MGQKVSLEDKIHTLDIIEVKLVLLPKQYPDSKYAFLTKKFISALSLDSSLDLIKNKTDDINYFDDVRDIKIVSTDTKGQSLYPIQDGKFPHFFSI